MVLTAYFVLSPVNGLSCHRRLRSCLQKLDAGIEASGPHDLTVRNRRVRLHAAASTASRSYVRDDRDTPLFRDGMAVDIEVIWVTRKQEYFCERSWTAKWLNSPSGKSVDPTSARFKNSSSLSPCGRGWLREAKTGEGSVAAERTPHPSRTSSTPPSPTRGEGEESAARGSFPARRRQRLHDFLKRRQRLAARGVRCQSRIAFGIEQLRMRFTGEAQHAGDRDIGVAGMRTGPVRRRDPRPLLFPHRGHAPHLRLPPLDPHFQTLLAQHALAEQADRP